MSVTKDQVVDFIKEMSVIELSEFVTELEDIFGVSAAAPVAMMAGPAADAGAGAAEQTEFDVVLSAAGDKKVQVIKVVREVTGLGLKEAKALVDGAPAAVKEAVSKEEAEEVAAKFEGTGASVEVK